MRVYFLIIFFCLSYVSYAQNTGTIKFYDVENGLPTNLITGIINDKNNLMWFGSGDGLIKFDGYEFTIYRHEINNPYSISDNWIRQLLLLDSLGNIWFLTADDKVCYFNPQTEKNFVKLDLRITSKSFGEINKIFHDKNGDIWIASNQLLYKFSLNIKNKFYESPKVFNIIVKSYAIDKNGNIWFGAKSGLYVYIQKENAIIKSKILQISGDCQVVTCQNQQLWVRTESFIYKIFLETKIADSMFLTNNMKEKQNLLMLDANQNLCLLTNNNLKIINLTNKTTTYIDSKMFRIKDNVVSKMFQLKDGSICIVSEDCFSLYDAKLYKFIKFPLTDGIVTNYLHFKILEDSNKNIYLLKVSESPKGSCLYMLDRSGGEFSKIELKNNHYNYENNYCRNMVFDANGNLWFDGDMIKEYVPIKKGFNNYLYRKSNHTLNNSDIWSFCRIYDKIWVSTNEGITCFSSADKSFSQPELFKHLKKTSITVTSENDIWISTIDAGLYYFNNPTGKIINYLHDTRNTKSIANNTIVCMFADSKKRIWCGFYDDGISVGIPRINILLIISMLKINLIL